MHVADLAATRTADLAGRFLGTLDQPGIRGQLLRPSEAGNVMDLVEDHQREDLAYPGHGAEAIQRIVIVILGRAEDEVLEFLKTKGPSADWIFNDEVCPRAGFLLGGDEIFPELYLYMKHCLFPWLGRNDY